MFLFLCAATSALTPIAQCKQIDMCGSGTDGGHGSTFRRSFFHLPSLCWIGCGLCLSFRDFGLTKLWWQETMVGMHYMSVHTLQHLINTNIYMWTHLERRRDDCTNELTGVDCRWPAVVLSNELPTCGCCASCNANMTARKFRFFCVFQFGFVSLYSET